MVGRKNSLWMTLVQLVFPFLQIPWLWVSANTDYQSYTSVKLIICIPYFKEVTGTHSFMYKETSNSA